jgi:hypothetical protein
VPLPEAVLQKTEEIINFFGFPLSAPSTGEKCIKWEWLQVAKQYAAILNILYAY